MSLAWIVIPAGKDELGDTVNKGPEISSAGSGKERLGKCEESWPCVGGSRAFLGAVMEVRLPPPLFKMIYAVVDGNRDRGGGE